jgi:hypothetical protein
VPPTATSKAAVAGGVTGAGVLIWLLDKLLVDGGEQAATMLTRLSPLLGPVWASWPLVLLIVIVAWVIRDKWTAAQAARALEVAAQQASATALATSVGEVATGLVGLRAEVHSLRGALQDHATGLGELRTEVSHVRERVSVLESPATRPPASARARRPT